MMKKTDIHIKNFKAVREELGFTQAEFAQELGIKNSTVEIERGRTKISGRVITQLLRKYHINPLWIYGYSMQQYLDPKGLNVSPKSVVVDNQGNENILLVDQKAAAGYPQNITDASWIEQLPAFEFPIKEYRNATYRGFQIEGDSMLPQFYPGDWVIAKAIENFSEAKSGSIYVFVLQDAVLIKKLQKVPNALQVILVSLNEEYAPMPVNMMDIREVWAVSSKLTFSLDTNNDSALLKELQQSMEELKEEFRQLKKDAS
ncbi:hypothetical protein GCM10009117_04980 [Gangjinia marincola]|uniref:HTH cro/C1-type domain-containing protein n=1 Tax=Gangjinia marincola TaxID=578463 RepID=A0ABP3XUP4_9FLAO